MYAIASVLRWKERPPRRRHYATSVVISTLMNPPMKSNIKRTSASIVRCQRQGSIFRARIINCLLIGTFLAELIWCYENLISPIFSYLGLVNQRSSMGPVIAGGVLVIALSLILPVHCRRASDYGVWVLYLGVVVPVSVIPFYLGLMSDGQVFHMQALIVAGFICLELFRRRPPLVLPDIPESRCLVRIGVPVLVLAVVTIVFGMQGFKVDMSIGSDMYVRRVEARSLLPAGSFLAYARSMAAKSGVPILAALTVIHRRFIYILVIAFSILGLISFDGQKAFLYGPVLCLLFGWVAKHHAYRAFNGSFLVAAAAGLAGLSIAEYLILGTPFLAWEFIRRLFVIPAQLTVYHFDFFRNHPLAWMTDGIIGTLNLARPIYNLPVSQVIGLNYFANPDMSANVNLWGSAYANFGSAGVLITSAAAGFLLRVIDSIVAQRPTRDRFIAGVIVTFMTCFTWTEGSFQTSLLTDGVLLSVLLLAIFPSGEQITKNTVMERKLGLTNPVAINKTARQA